MTSSRRAGQEPLAYLEELTAKSGTLRGQDLPAFYDRLEREHARVLAELDRYERDEPTAALRMATLLQPFWFDRGHLHEGRRRLARALEIAPDAPAADRAKALYAAGTLAFRQPDNTEARRLLREGLEITRAQGDRAAEAQALGGLARCALRDGDAKEAGALAEEAMRIQRELGNERGVAAALHIVAYAAYVEGNDDRARRLFEESIALERRLENIRSTAADLTNLGSIETRAGNLARAADLCAESLRVAMETHSDYLLPYCVANIGGVVAARGNDVLGARLLGAAQRMFERSQAAIDPGTAIEFERHKAKVRSALGERAFRDSWDGGRALANEEAIALARDSIVAEA